MIDINVTLKYQNCVNQARECALKYDWERASQFYRDAINVLETSFIDDDDMLEKEFLIKETTFLIYHQISSVIRKNKEISWIDDDEAIDALVDGKEDLLNCEKFYLDILDKFSDGESPYYVRALDNIIQIYLIIAQIEGYADRPKERVDCLKFALAACDDLCYRQNDFKNLFLNATICYKLGISETPKISQRREYLFKAFNMEKNILKNPLLTKEDCAKTKKLLNYTSGMLMKCRLLYLHPDIDLDSDSICDDAFEYYNTHSTKINKRNFLAFFCECRDFLIETRSPINPQIFDDDDINPQKGTIFAMMLSTCHNVIVECVDYVKTTFNNGYKYLPKKPSYLNPKKGEIRAQGFFDKLVDFGELFSDFARIMLEHKPSDKTLLDVILFVTKYASTAAINLNLMPPWSYQKIESANFLCIDRLFYCRLANVLYDYEINVESELKFVTTRNITKDIVSEIKLFAFCIKAGEHTIDRYLSKAYKNEYRCWYHYYVQFKNANDDNILSELDTIGEFLTENINNLSVRRILYHNNFYELAALEFAYRKGDNLIAAMIIHNGYDNYLEIGTLYIIWIYDKTAFYKYIKQLKRVCLEFIIGHLDDSNPVQGNYDKNFYKREFIDELLNLSQIELSNIDPSDNLDNRNRDIRRIPDWAK